MATAELQAETLGREVAERATEFAPRRRRNLPAAPILEAPAAETPEADIMPPSQRELTPNALRIASQLDAMERGRADASAQRDAAHARIEQFEGRVSELTREKHALETKLEDARNATELERNERIRLSDAMEGAIHLLQQKLPMPNPQ